MDRLFLFDIDGTLCDTGGAGASALNLAFELLFEIRDAFRTVRMDGKTDLQIIREGLAANGLEAGQEKMEEIGTRYLRQLRVQIDNDRMHLKPGVIELLAALENTPGCHLGLLTGNIEKGARIKLEPFGLNAYFSFGAFGSDHEDRRRLVPVALQKFSALNGIRLNPSDCVVIGDTPLDVACAKPHGALSVAVATGNYTFEELQQSGADLVLHDLTGALPLLIREHR